jgi:uncharacterized Tic20 family protein
MAMMFAYFLIAFIVLVGPLAYWAGKDSRIDENDRLRHYLG